MPDPAPQPFVSRDRARRFARRLAALRDARVLAWKGASVGMSVVRDDADAAFAEALADLETSAADVVAGRARDRERAYLDVPFAAMTEGLAGRVALARKVEEARVARRAAGDAAHEAIRDLLEACLRRIDAFCAAYDEKRPMGPARSTDVARLLRVVETEASWDRALRPPDDGARAFDRPPPPLPSDPAGLEDLLLAARAAVPDAPGPWRVRPSDAGAPLALSLGAEGGAMVPAPDRLARAAQVLAFLHPVQVACVGEGDAVRGVVVRAADLGGGSVRLAVAAAAGAPADLSPDVDRVVRALLAAPPSPEGAPVPPARLVALQGVLKAVDREVPRALGPRVAAGSARAAAARLPREDTRKAPPRREVLHALETELPGLPVHRVDAVAADLAQGKLPPKALDASTAAVVLALVGRTWTWPGGKMERGLDLRVGDEETLAAVRDLLDVAAVRKDLEAGRDVPPAALTRLERAAIATLGRLARLR